ncbi:MAG: hypothetical protein ACO2PM_21845 [Pyrobaculum sp.]
MAWRSSRFNIYRVVYHFMDINEIKQRLELALRPAEPPTLEEVLKQVSTRGVLRGPMDWIFPAWRLYVDYVVKEIVGGFKLSAEEEDQLKDFGWRLNTLLEQAERQAKAKLTSIYRVIMEDTYKLEGNKLYAPDGTWIYMGATLRLKIHGVSVSARFPDVLKLPRNRLDLLQLGWKASDEGEMFGRPFMGTAQPWQVFAWAAARCGELYTLIASVTLTHEGMSINVYIRARSWRQRWSKDEAISLVAGYLRRGEWAPLFTAWLGDGKARWKNILRGKYMLSIATKEPWRLGLVASTYEAIVATGKEAFIKLKESAGVYGALLDLLRAHKWIYIKLATDDGLRVAYKLNKKGITVAGVVMYLRLVSGRGGSLLAEHYTRDLGKALEVADKLKATGLRPNIVRSNANYVVYIATADLLRLAERDETVRKAIALYLTEKAKNGTPKQREIAEKILKRHPLFQTQPLEVGILNWL